MKSTRTLALCAAALLSIVPLACRKGRSAPEASAQKPTAEKKVLYWYDPMKPEVHFNAPGKSPFMDMQLVPMYAEETPAAAAESAKKVLYWYDPMHPQYKADHPGKSPDCGMDMVPKYAEEEPQAAPATAPPGFSVVRIPLERRQEIGVTTARVERRPVAVAVQTNGVVAEDEGRVTALNAKFAGYIERLFVDRTGQSVRRGQPLFSVYSPELVATQRELLLALENARRLEGASSAAAGTDAQALVAAARQRLRFWDIPQPEIDRIERTGEVAKTLTLRSPVSGVVLKKDAVAGLAITPGMPLYTIADLSTVWVLADVYEAEIASIRSGNAGEVVAPSLSGETFRGRVDFVYPTVAEETRTVKVRLVLPNSGGLLKPGMFVRVALKNREKEALAVPRDALVRTGERQIAFVEQSPGVYIPREVKTGLEGGGYVEVTSGLSPGETVVTSANFLIDSESRIGAMGAAPAGSAGQPQQSLGARTPEPKR